MKRCGNVWAKEELIPIKPRDEAVVEGFCLQRNVE